MSSPRERRSGLAVDADVAAAAPGLTWIATGLLVGGVVALVVGALGVVLPIRAVGRISPTRSSLPRP